MTPHRNRALFSNYYLNELLPKEEEFNIPISEVTSFFEKVKGTWDKSRFEAINEDQLRIHFLDKVLGYLGWAVDVNAPVPTGEWSKRPDYALFKNEDSLRTAQKGKKEGYFKKAICIAEAKRWGRPLDKKLKTEKDPFEFQNPSLQISRYLWLTSVKWGILTDGKYWRLYEREASKRLDIFYEVDLEDLIESGSPEYFRYFYLLFRKDAFPEFIEKVYKGSVDYAEAVGEELKENIYLALKTLAQGFLKTPGNNLQEAPLKEIHDNSLIVLYRLLFILYAEYRGLLPLGVNRLYTDSYSLDVFKKEIASRLDKNEPIATSTFGYWNKLKELFEIINIGNKELGVPPYNGGLFDPEKHKFLETRRVGDLYVAKAIDLLSRSKDKAFIDYGSLEIRHLGSIYEGLLEYKLKIADQNLIPIKDKGKEVFIPFDEAKKQKKTIKEDETVHAGEIYLVTDRGERKATGSYYTPGYIVKYIVENTLGSLVKEKREKVSINIKELKEKIKGSKGVNRESYKKELRRAEGSLIDEILSLKVLDPAMGSGHFLVEATDFLARELLKVLSGEPLDEHSKEMVIREGSEHYGLKEPEEEDIRWARREVVERCIFGVDLNPLAVELAKLSLWLYTVAKNRPLNFLDHHLRCGNSLIGAKIDDLASLPELKKKKVEAGPVQFGLFESIFKEKVNILLGAFAQIEMLPSDTVEQIRGKEKLYQDFRKIVSRFQDVADIWTSICFGNDIDFGNYQELQNNLRSTEEEWGKLTQEIWFKKAKEISNEKRFFHWELEFPEIFFEGHKRKENPGFEAVVGNPPYVDSENMIKSIPDERKYINRQFETAKGNWDLYVPFWELSINKINSEGNASLITPNKWLSIGYGRALRKLLKENLFLISDFSKIKVFEGSGIFTVVAFASKDKNKNVDIQLFEDNYKLAFHQTISKRALSKFDNLGVLFTQSFPLIERVIWECKKLSEICKVEEAFTVSEAYQLSDFIQELSEFSKNNFFKLVITGTIDRYVSRWGIAHTKYLKTEYLMPVISSKKFKDFSHRRYEQAQSKKIIISGIRYFESFLDKEGEFIAGKSTVILRDISGHCNFETILALMNSRFVTYYLKESFGSLAMDEGINFTAPLVSELPIPRISFTTNKKEREQLADETKNYYKKYVEIGKPNTILHFVESRLMKEHKTDAELVKKHNSDPLNKDWKIPEGALWKQADVVHDILAFLAEQMIEMNKEKQSEIKGFIGWLESQLKIQPDKEDKGIDTLTGKKQIKNYLGDYQKEKEYLPFEEFWKILEKNKNRIQASLKSRELYENVRLEYDKSLSKLLPLKEKLHRTDWLIDQIVYKLYDLTEKEIKIIEGQDY